MPDTDDLVRLAYEHQAQQIRLTERAVEATDRAWRAYGGLSDEAAAAFTDAVVPIMSTAIEQTVALTDANMAQYVTTATGERFAPTEITSADIAYRNGSGVELSEVYSRPINAARMARARGASEADALEAGRARARQLADTDVHAAARSSADEIMKRVPRCVGYRRLPDPDACEYCLIASTQRYHVGTLAGIHPSCHCSTLPIIGTHDPGRIIDKDAHARLKSAGAIDEKNYERRIADGEKLPARYRAEADKARGKARATDDPIARKRYESRAESWDARADSRAARVDDDRARLAEVRARRAGSPDAIVTRDHHELGPTLGPKGSSHHVRAEPPDPPPVRRSKAKPSDGDVLAEANRRGVTPERVVEMREEKAQARYLEQRARREAAKSISAESPEVIDLAKRFKVHPDEIVAARARVGDIRAVAREQAAEVQRDALAELDRLDAFKIKSPIHARHAGGEYDWLEQVSDREKARLSRQWYGGQFAPDQIAHSMSEIIGRDLDVDEAMAEWMRLNRRAEAAGALRRGKIPSLDAYSGQIDPADMIPGLSADGYDVFRIFGDDLEAAAHIAATERDLLAEDALRYLGRSANPIHGPAPYRMSFQSWEGEVRDIEHRLATHAATDLDRARYDELVPEALDEPELDFETLYARVISTARKAGEEVPRHATIPW